MHHIHHTEAFVLGSRPQREDSKMLILYTRELGLVYAYAQGIRKLSSRLRFTLQDLSHAQVDLVRGKDMWRLTTAVPMQSYTVITDNPEAERVVSRIAALLVRLVAGEEPSERIFTLLSEVYHLCETGEFGEGSYRPLELWSVGNILIALGYLSSGREGFTEETDASRIPALFSESTFQHHLIRDINQALTATQL